MDTSEKPEMATGPWWRFAKVVCHPAVLITIGALLEVRAGMLVPTNIGKTTSIDEVYSLCASILIASGTLWYLRRLGRIPLELKLAVALVLGAKVVDLVGNIHLFDNAFLIGRDDLRSKSVQSILFSVETVLTLLGTIRLARRIWGDTLELRRRNATLVREREALSHARSALERSEHMLQSVIENLPDGVFWKDRNFRYLGSNQRHANHNGVSSPAILIGKSSCDFPWLLDTAEFHKLCDLRVIETGEAVHNVIEPTQFEDGSTGWLRTNRVALRSASGEIFGVLGTSEDITEEKRRDDERARLVTAMEQSDESVIITDPDGLILYVNPAFERVSGYSSAEVLGQIGRAHV